MEIRIDQLLEKKGKTRYWLAKEIGITYPNLMKLAEGETVSIKFKIMEDICEKLECTPNDLFGWKE